jgi:hypothetical protein
MPTVLPDVNDRGEVTLGSLVSLRRIRWIQVQSGGMRSSNPSPPTASESAAQDTSGRHLHQLTRTDDAVQASGKLMMADRVARRLRDEEAAEWPGHRTAWGGEA